MGHGEESMELNTDFKYQREQISDFKYQLSDVITVHLGRIF